MVTARLNPDKTDGGNSRPGMLILLGLGILSGVGYLFNFQLQKVVPFGFRLNEIQFYLVLLLVLNVLYLSGVVLVEKYRSQVGNSWLLLGILIFFSIFFRICLVPAAPTVLSQDMYRYVWDGRVQQNGINPYLYPPVAEELENFQDELIFPHINRKQAPTIYPAAAQLLFRLFYGLAGDSVTGFKGFMVIFDMLTILMLTGLLSAYGFAPARMIIYAWNPLVIFEIAYSGHLEGLTIFFLVTAFYLHALQKKKSAVMLLAAASAMKLYPALLLAALLNRGRRIKGLLLFSATLALLYLPYTGAGRRIIGFLPTYLNNPYESFNLGLKSLLLLVFPGLDYALVSQFFLFILLLAAVTALMKEKQHVEVLRAAYWLTGLLLLFMPASLHPWYVILIIPFLAFFPNPAWLLFTGTVSLSYLKYVAPQEIMPTWVLLAEYLPLFVLLAATWFLNRPGIWSRLSALVFARRLNSITEEET